MLYPARLPTGNQPASNSDSRSKLRCGLLTVWLALGCFVLAATPSAFGVSPPPDGGYPNQNTAEGNQALFSLTSGTNNTALGFHALFSNTSGEGNTATGSSALEMNTDGFSNTANGSNALRNNTTGFDNTTVGFSALFSNTTGADNTAVGSQALFLNTKGVGNTAIGAGALVTNATGNRNTAVGTDALESNTTGDDNTAIGLDALLRNRGNGNTASGVGALFNNTRGNNNTASGFFALRFNTAGSDNLASGKSALENNGTGSQNTASGVGALANNRTGSNNIALGFQAGINLTRDNDNIDIGNAGVAGDSKTIRIGDPQTHTAIFIAGISGVPVKGDVVVASGDGKLGIRPSSERFKDEIKSMGQTSEAIFALEPVTFHYKQELDPDAIPQFGLVAEQVEKINPDLVARDKEGKAYTVRYEAVNVMLLNEFLKEHRKVEEQGTRIVQQRKDFEAAMSKVEAVAARQQKQIEILTDKLQRVSERVELTKSPTRLAVEND